MKGRTVKGSLDLRMEGLRFSSRFSGFGEVLQFRAETSPEKDAFIFLENGEKESHRMSFSEVDGRARAIAGIISKTCSPGDRALLLYLPDLDYVLGFLGCLYAGVIPVPAYPPDPSRLELSLSRLVSVCGDSGARVALSVGMVAGLAGEIFSKTPGLKHLKWLCTEEHEPVLPDKWRLHATKRDSLAFLQYTSGSTGTPKGVMVTHENLLENAAIIKDAFEDTEDTVGVFWLPPYHDMGLIGGILQPVYLGATAVLMSPLAFLQKPVRWLSAISAYKATTSGGPDFAYDLCARKARPEDKKNLDLSAWRLAFNGAEPVRADTMNRFAEAFSSCGFSKNAFYPCYGLAESTLFVSGGSKEDPPVLKDMEVGNPGDNTSARMRVGCGGTRTGRSLLIVDQPPFARKAWRVKSGCLDPTWLWAIGKKPMRPPVYSGQGFPGFPSKPF
ncbi:MAG: fatty acyl-AMP ligase [Deltaproteobacteria bacterium]|nr:fatty acyl-AMP ligase [Deltaproteobacteria bacterium]